MPWCIASVLSAPDVLGPNRLVPGALSAPSALPGRWFPLGTLLGRAEPSTQDVRSERHMFPVDVVAPSSRFSRMLLFRKAVKPR